MIFNSLMNRTTEERVTLENPDPWFLDFLMGGSASSSGQRVNHKTALALSAYFACIRNISEDTAKLPIKVFKDSGESRLPQPSHPLSHLWNRQPNEDMTAFDFRSTLIAHALGYQGGFAEIVRTGEGLPVGLHLLDPTAIKVKRHLQTKEVIYTHQTPNFGQVVLMPHEIFHIHGLGFDGLTSYILNQMGKQNIGTFLETQKYAGEFFGNFAVSAGVLEFPNALKEESIMTLRKQFSERLQDGIKNKKPVVLEDGAKWSPVSTNPEQSQMTQTMRFYVEDVCRWFRMPPHKIQHLEKAIKSNIESENRVYTDTLEPWTVRIEQEILRKLFMEDEIDFHANHNYNALMRGDINTRTNHYINFINAGVYSINEVRSFENLNPIGEEGDQHLIQANNMAPVGDFKSKEPEDDEDEDKGASAIKKSFTNLLAGTISRVLKIEYKKIDSASIKEKEFYKWKEEKFTTLQIDTVNNAIQEIVYNFAEAYGIICYQSDSIDRDIIQFCMQSFSTDHVNFSVETFNSNNIEIRETRANIEAEYLINKISKIVEFDLKKETFKQIATPFNINYIPLLKEEATHYDFEME